MTNIGSVQVLCRLEQVQHDLPNLLYSQFEPQLRRTNRALLPTYELSQCHVTSVLKHEICLIPFQVFIIGDLFVDELGTQFGQNVCFIADRN